MHRKKALEQVAFAKEAGANECGALEEVTFFFSRWSFQMNGYTRVWRVQLRVRLSVQLPHSLLFRTVAAPECAVLLTVCAFYQHLGGFQ